MRNRDVDDYNARLSPEFQAILEQLRQLVEETVPDAIEVLSGGNPAWHGKRTLASVSASDKHLTLSFDRGASFTDDEGWLEGNGFNTRYLTMKSIEELPEDAVRDYLTQAAALDARG